MMEIVSKRSTNYYSNDELTSIKNYMSQLSTEALYTIVEKSHKLNLFSFHYDKAQIETILKEALKDETNKTIVYRFIVLGASGDFMWNYFGINKKEFCLIRKSLGDEALHRKPFKPISEIPHVTNINEWEKLSYLDEKDRFAQIATSFNVKIKDLEPIIKEYKSYDLNHPDTDMTYEA